MRYRLRTLLIVLAVAPPILAGLWYIIVDVPSAIVVALLAMMLFGLVMFWRSLTNEPVN